MEWFDFLVLVLASSGMLEAWFKGSLFTELRAVMQDKDTAFWSEMPRSHWSLERSMAAADEDAPGGTSQPVWLRLVDWWVPNFVGALLSCSFCFSYHAPFWLGLLFWAPSLWLPAPWSAILKLPLYALAATRAGNIATGLLPAKLRYEAAEDDNAA